MSFLLICIIKGCTLAKHICYLLFSAVKHALYTLGNFPSAVERWRWHHCSICFMELQYIRLLYFLCMKCITGDHTNRKVLTITCLSTFILKNWQGSNKIWYWKSAIELVSWIYFVYVLSITTPILHEARTEFQNFLKNSSSFEKIGTT